VKEKLSLQLEVEEQKDLLNEASKHDEKLASYIAKALRMRRDSKAFYENISRRR
jgi:hypothetical protein